MRVELSVDELVLVGFDPRERLRLGDALERALAERIDGAAVAGITANDCGECAVMAPDARSEGGPGRRMAGVADSIVRGLTAGGGR